MTDQPTTTTSTAGAGTASATLTSSVPLLALRTVACELCGRQLALGGRGRPRRYCLDCRPRTYQRKSTNKPVTK